jgi:hypothetical protein
VSSAGSFLIPKLLELMGYSLFTCVSNPIEREKIFNVTFFDHLKALKGEKAAREIGQWISKDGNIQRNIPNWEVYESPLLDVPLSESQIRMLAQEKAALALEKWEALALVKQSALPPSAPGFWLQVSSYITDGAHYIMEHPWQAAGGWVLIVTSVAVCYLLGQNDTALKAIDLTTGVMKKQIAEAVKAEVHANPALTLMKHNMEVFQDTAMDKIIYVSEGLDTLTALLIEKEVLLPDEIYEQGVAVFV